MTRLREPSGIFLRAWGSRCLSSKGFCPFLRNSGGGLEVARTGFAETSEKPLTGTEDKLGELHPVERPGED